MPATKKVVVRLTSDQRDALDRLLRTGSHPAAMRRRAFVGVGSVEVGQGHRRAQRSGPCGGRSRLERQPPPAMAGSSTTVSVGPTGVASSCS